MLKLGCWGGNELLWLRISFHICIINCLWRSIFFPPYICMASNAFDIYIYICPSLNRLIGIHISTTCGGRTTRQILFNLHDKLSLKKRVCTIRINYSNYLISSRPLLRFNESRKFYNALGLEYRAPDFDKWILTHSSSRMINPLVIRDKILYRSTRHDETDKIITCFCIYKYVPREFFFYIYCPPNKSNGYKYGLSWIIKATAQVHRCYKRKFLGFPLRIDLTADKLLTTHVSWTYSPRIAVFCVNYVWVHGCSY